MFRLINAESYKLKKSKSFFICSIVMVCFVLLLFGMLFLADGIQKGNFENGTGGVTITKNGSDIESASGSIFDEINLMDILQQVFSGSMMSCTLAIFVSIFVIGEFGSGMIKNIVGKGCSKTAIYLSKLFMTALASICIALAGVLTLLLFGRIFIGTQAFSNTFWHNFFIYTGIQLLIVISLSALFMLTSELCRTTAGGISLNIGIIVLSSLLMGGLDAIYTAQKIKPSQFWIISQSERLPLEGFTASSVTQSLLVAVFWFVLTTLLGIWHFRKSDIK